jgi:hypothetical protein
LLEELNEKMDRLYDVQMSTFVQLSRIYDLLALTAMGETAEGLTQVLVDHKMGVIQTAVPTVHTFGAAWDDDEEDQ